MLIIRKSMRYLISRLSVLLFFNGNVTSNIFQDIASGAAQPKLSNCEFEKFEIPFPPLPVQRKIAAVLSAYDDLIEVNTRRIRMLEEMAQAVYREWFGSVDAASLPEGWEVDEDSMLLQRRLW